MGADSVVIAVNVDCTAAAMAMGHASALCNRQGVRCDGKDSVKPSGSADCKARAVRRPAATRSRERKLNKRENRDAASPGTARQAQAGALGRSQAVIDSVPSRRTLPSCVGEMGASCSGSA